MGVIVSAHQLSKAFAARPLFRGLTFSVESGERIGLIGPNGAGKSTLLRILASAAGAAAEPTSPDEGTLSLQRGLRVGLLAQVPRFRGGATVLSSVLEGAGEGHAEDWEAISLAQELISKCQLDGLGNETPVARLSGGWQKRIALARELMKKPDLLLLDEPTNHLDVESILWLEELLAGARYATITITHDRMFLQRVANRIFELDPRHPGGLLSVQGDYATYLEVREGLIAAQERREIILKNTLRRETEWLRQGAKARTTKQQARIKRAGELADEVQDLTSRNIVRTARLDFQGAEKNPKKLVEAKRISKSYGSREIFRELDLLLTPGLRLGLLGPNGSGKSTLIRTLVGQEEPSAGSIARSEHLTVAYFDQTREALDPQVTVLRTLCPTGETVEYRGTRLHVRSYLDRFLFTQGQMDMEVGKLSGGEQSRLLIAQLMLRPANLLVLDEPTNDLDLATLSVLEECLTEFNGAVILVTHDRYFLDQVANRLLAFVPRNGEGAGHELVPFADLAQWEAWMEARAAEMRAKRATTARTEPAATASAPAAAKKRKLSYNEQRELDSMEANIHAAEAEVTRLSAEVALPANATNASLLAQLTGELSEAQRRVDHLYHRWAELSGE